MSFDSSGSHLYAHLTLLPGGVRHLSHGSRERRRKQIGQQQTAANTLIQDDPGSIGEFRKLLRYLKIPSVFHRLIIFFVAIGTALAILYAAWAPISGMVSSVYGRIPFVVQIQKLDKEINDSKTGLPAIADRLDRSRAQLQNVTAFLVAKYPEFGALILSDARKAAEKGDIPEALTFLRLANDGFQRAQAHKTTAPPEFFATATRTLSNIPSEADVLQSQIHDVRIALANYSSALRSVPNLKIHHGTPIRSPLLIAHLTFDLTHGDGLIVNLYPPEQLAVKVFDENVVKGFQQLDGIRWVDVTFVGTQIRYNGGPVELTNVRFVDCTFISPPNPNAAQFLDYAALGLTKFTAKSVG